MIGWTVALVLYVLGAGVMWTTGDESPLLRILSTILWPIGALVVIAVEFIPDRR